MNAEIGAGYRPGVRNSAILSAFDEVLHSPLCGWRAVGIAGRGIVLQARCSQMMLADKGRRYDDPPEQARRRALDAADRLIALGELEDDLVETVRRRLGGETREPEFEEALDDVVRRLEAWIVSWPD
ncbi:hypothetical protein AB0J83_47455 [Actinoplanes sp. NPDC049596]|uniref:hypothetical protein n=1 Tax=unclassified Actinoplanes TaxID=2626549 RepID=UPI003440FD88